MAASLQARTEALNNAGSPLFQTGLEITNWLAASAAPTPFVMLASQGPKENQRVPSSYQLYGLHGEQWAQQLLGSMYQTTSEWTVSHWWNSGNSLFNGLTDQISGLILDRATAWLGADYWATHSSAENWWALARAGRYAGERWVANGLMELHESGLELAMRELHIWGLYAQGEFTQGNEQQQALNMGLFGESGVIHELGEMALAHPYAKLLNLGLNEFFNVSIPKIEEIQKGALASGQALHLGAARSGQQGALATDVAYRVVEFTVQIAGDVAVEVLSAGAATPAIVAKWALTAGRYVIRAAETGLRLVRVAVSAAKWTAPPLYELAAGAVKLGFQAAKYPLSTATSAVRAVPALLSKTRNFAVDVASTAKVLVQQALKRNFNTVGTVTGEFLKRQGWDKPLGRALHALDGSSGEKTLLDVANWLKIKACFVAGTPIETPSGSKSIEELKDYYTHGDDCDTVLSRNEFDPNAPVIARRVLRRFIRTAPVLSLTVNGHEIGTTAEHPFFKDGHGWTPAHELSVGDWLLTRTGQKVWVDDIVDTGKVLTMSSTPCEPTSSRVGCLLCVSCSCS